MAVTTNAVEALSQGAHKQPEQPTTPSNPADFTAVTSMPEQSVPLPPPNRTETADEPTPKLQQPAPPPVRESPVSSMVDDLFPNDVPEIPVRPNPTPASSSTMNPTGNASMNRTPVSSASHSSMSPAPGSFASHPTSINDAVAETRVPRHETPQAICSLAPRPEGTAGPTPSWLATTTAAGDTSPSGKRVPNFDNEAFRQANSPFKATPNKCVTARVAASPVSHVKPTTVVSAPRRSRNQEDAPVSILAEDESLMDDILRDN